MKNLKRIKRASIYVVIPLLICILLYMLTSFIFLEFNPMKMEVDQRCMIVFSIIIGLVIGLFTDLAIYNIKKDLKQWEYTIQ